MVPKVTIQAKYNPSYPRNQRNLCKSAIQTKYL